MVARSLVAALTLGAAVSLAGCCAAPACIPCPPTCSITPANPWLAAARVHGRGNVAGWTYLSRAYDADRDGRVAAKEYPRDPKTFARLDRDGDGVLTAADFSGPTRMDGYLAALVLTRLARRESDAVTAAPVPAAPNATTAPPAPTAPPDEDAIPEKAALERAVARADRDRSGAIDERELDRALAEAQAIPATGVYDLPAGVRPFPSLLAALDEDRSGSLTQAEVDAWREQALVEKAKAEKEEAERVKEVAAKAEQAKEESAKAEMDGVEKPEAGKKTVADLPRKRPEAPAVGTAAPEFALRSPDGGTTVSLSSLRGRPVVLVFGSYTCPPFRHAASWINRAFDEHGREAVFVFVYVREAHAIDGRAPMPAEDQPIVEEPRTFDERCGVAGACSRDLGFARFLTLVDDVDDAVARAYVAPPARLYVVARDGTIAYRSDPGPFGLKAAEFEAAVRAAVRPRP